MSTARLPSPRSGRRRKRRSAGSTGSVYDWPILLALLLAPILGLVFFAGVRLYVAGPLTVITFLAVAALLIGRLVSGSEPTWKLPPGMLGLVLFGLYLVAMIPRAAVPHEALVEGLKYASYLVAYWAICELAAVRGRWRILLAIPVIVGTLICWYALIQHAHGSRMVLFLERPEGYRMRASGTHMCPNHFAQVLEMFMVMGFALAATRSAGWPLRMLGFYALILAMPVLVLTGSRSGWIGAVAGIGVTVVLMAARKGWRRLAVILPVFILVVTVGIGALWQTSPLFKSRVEQAFRGDIRPVLWKDTLGLIQDQPVLGHGGGSFRWVFPAFQDASINAAHYARYAHNEYLHLTADYGAVGAALLGIALLTLIFRLLKLHFSTRDQKSAQLAAGLLGCMAAVLAHSFFDFNLHIFANVHILVLIAGSVTGALYASGDLRPVPIRRLTTRAGLLLSLPALAVLVFLSARATAGYGLAERSEKERKDLHLDSALRLADRAVAIEPSYWRAHVRKGHVYKTRGFWDLDPAESERQAGEAVAAYERALELNPYDLQTKLELSRTYGDLLGESDKSVRLLEETVAAAPGNFEYRAELGLRLRRMGRTEEALKAFKSARKIHHEDEMVRLNIRSLERIESGKVGK